LTNLKLRKRKNFTKKKTIEKTIYTSLDCFNIFINIKYFRFYQLLMVLKKVSCFTFFKEL